MTIHTHAPRPAPLANALCPACGRAAINLGDNLFHCAACGKVGIEPVGLRHFVHTDAQGGFGIGDAPRPDVNIRWTCGVVPGCTHDTEADANKHRVAGDG